MKMRWVTLLTIAAMFSSFAVYAQTVTKEESTRRVAPIVATVDGFDTGLTVINTGTTPLTVKNFVFYSLSGVQTTGLEAAEVDLVNRKLTGLSFTVPGNGRFSMLASQLIGRNLNGQLRFSVTGRGALNSISLQATFDPNFGMDTIQTGELTRREQSPR